MCIVNETYIYDPHNTPAVLHTAGGVVPFWSKRLSEVFSHRSEEESSQEGKQRRGERKRLILTVGNLLSSLITHVSLLSCVCLSARVSCLAPLNRAQMPGGYRDIT